MVSRSGLIGFSHNYLRQAVERKFLKSELQQQATHLRLADYFHDRELGPRKLDELPWQLAEGRRWKALVALLTDSEFFGMAWQSNRFEVKKYWARIEGRSPLRMLDAYESVLAGRGDAHFAWRVALLLMDAGYPNQAGDITKKLVGYFRSRGDNLMLAAALGNQAMALRAQGDLEQAMALRREEERIFRERGDRAGLAVSLGNQANILYERGRPDEALGLQKNREKLCRELGSNGGLALSLAAQAVIFQERGEPGKATMLLEEAERLFRQLGDTNGLAGTLNEQALILEEAGRLDEALTLNARAEALFRQVGDKTGLARSLGNQGNIRRAQGQLQEGLALHQAEERLYQEMGLKKGLAESLGNQAVIFQEQGQLAQAMATHKEQERLYREVGDKRGLALCLAAQAMLLVNLKKVRSEVVALLEQAQQLAASLSNPSFIGRIRTVSVSRYKSLIATWPGPQQLRFHLLSRHLALVPTVPQSRTWPTRSNLPPGKLFRGTNALGQRNHKRHGPKRIRKKAVLEHRRK